MRLTPKLETWTIVAAGAWNTRLFTPEWVSAHVFEEKQISVEVPLALSGLKYAANDVVVVPADDRLIFGVSRTDNETLSRAERMMCKVLELLRHTPVQAVGVNFGFDVVEPDSAFTSLFELQDNSRIAEIGGTIATAKLTRSIVINDNVVLVSLSWANEQFSAHLNFHADVTSADAAVQRLRNRVASYRDNGVDLLKRAYGFELTEGDGQ